MHTCQFRRWLKWVSSISMEVVSLMSMKLLLVFYAKHSCPYHTVSGTYMVLHQALTQVLIVHFFLYVDTWGVFIGGCLAMEIAGMLSEERNSA